MTHDHDRIYGRPSSASGSEPRHDDCPPERVQICSEQMARSAHDVAHKILQTLFAVDIDDPASIEEFQNRRRREAELHAVIEKAMTGTLWGIAKITAAILIAIGVLHLKEIAAWFGKP